MATSARRSKATTNTAPDGTKLNKDGTPRKKPGPRPGTARGSGSKTAAAKPAADTTTKAKPGPKPGRKKAAKKTFLIYAVDGNELSFATEAPGLTGQIAVAAAVKNGTLAPNTPYVFLTPTTVARQVEVEAVEREVQYKVKPVVKKRATRKSRAEAATGAEEAQTEEIQGEPEVKSARASKAAPAVAHPEPGETGVNPFAE